MLLRLHRIGMDDHLYETIEGLKAIRGDSMIIVSRGEVYTMGSDDFDETMESIMNSRDHYIYDDLIRPGVRVSRDGSLGWVIVQVSAKGVFIDQKGDRSYFLLNFKHKSTRK